MPRSITSAGVAAGIWLALSCSAGFAQSDDWRVLRIDGSSEAGFESSVAQLRNSLPRRRREDFDTALAVIWMSENLGPAGLDLDGNGSIDYADLGRLADETADLLADIQRGELLSSIEKRATHTGGAYTPASYLRQLDGLTYEQVFNLAGRPAKVSAATLARAARELHPELGNAFDPGLDGFRSLIHGAGPPPAWPGNLGD